jgi:two-component system response regulator DesR
VLLLDLDMPGKDALTALEEVSEACPDVRTLILTGHLRSDFIERSIDAGAWGYVLKSEGTGAIVAALRMVAAGGFSLGPQAKTVFTRANTAAIAPQL